MSLSTFCASKPNIKVNRVLSIEVQGKSNSSKEIRLCIINNWCFRVDKRKCRRTNKQISQKAKKNIFFLNLYNSRKLILRISRLLRFCENKCRKNSGNRLFAKISSAKFLPIKYFTVRSSPSLCEENLLRSSL